MTESNRAAVNVGPGTIKAQFFFDREILSSEGLVDLDQVNI